MRLRRRWPYVALIVVACRSPAREITTDKPEAAAPSIVVPTGADPELVAIATSMCAASYREDDKHNVIVGCRKPLPFDGAGRKPDGKLERFTSDDLMAFCSLGIVARGAFTAPGKEQVLVEIENCRDDTSSEGWNASLPGGAALVEKVDGRWKTIATQPAVDVGACKVVRRMDGRDTLFCHSGFGAFSIGMAISFFYLDFHGSKPTAKTVGFVYDDIETFTCVSHEGQPTWAPSGLTRARIEKVTVSGATVEVDVERAHAPASAALETKLHALCKRNAPSIAEVAPTATRARLDFVVAGDGFEPTPATKALLAKWRTESPDVTQLEGTAPPKIDP